MATPLSVHILSFNRADRLRRCLESVRWADEVQVVDSGSTDGSLELARELADLVLEHPFRNAADQHIWGLHRVSHDWVLVVDSDEWVTPELAAEIQEVLARGPDRDGYYLQRRSLFLGREIRYSGWQRDRIVRLFRRSKGGYPARHVHSVPEIQGSVGRLRGILMHEPYEDLGDYLQRIHRFTTWGAQEAHRRGRRFRVSDLLLRPLWRFLRHYLFMRGFLDGFHGLVISVMTTYYVFLKYLKLWEIQHRGAPTGEEGAPAPDTS